jgi:hypothetical protein
MPDDPVEQSAEIENDAIEAMQSLVEDFGYTEDDLLNMVKAALRQ